MDKQTDKQDRAKQPGEPRAALAKTWGLTSAEFTAALQSKPVRVELVNGKAYAGELIGVDQYDILIKQANGLMLLVPKHAVALLHASKNGGAQAS